MTGSASSLGQRADALHVVVVYCRARTCLVSPPPLMSLRSATACSAWIMQWAMCTSWWRHWSTS
jgi:hypothetical protein